MNPAHPPRRSDSIDTHAITPGPRPWHLWTNRTAILTAVAAIAISTQAIAIIPGFGALEYYFALAASFPLSVVSMLLGVWIAAPDRFGSPSERIRAAASTVAASCLLCAVSLAVVGLNAFRVRNCSPATGLHFFAWGPLPGALFSGLCGWFLATATRTRKLAIALGLLLLLGSVARHLWAFATTPRIFFYDPFFGYWSGAIYDEVIRVGAPLRWFRLSTLADSAFLLCLGVWWVRPRGSGGVNESRGATPLTRFRLKPIGLTALCGLACCALFLLGGELGWAPGYQQLQRELDGTYATQHCLVRFPTKDRRLAAEVSLIAEDCEFRLAQLAEWFEDPAEGRTTVWVYSSRAQKRRLMGADRVYIAKPWLAEIHLAPIEYGEPVLKHELAHVFAARYAPGPLRVASQWGFLPHMGLIEGLATAAEGYRDRLSLHQWSAALQVLGKLPDLVKVMGPQGYWASYGPTAYTTAGSLLLFMVEQKGISALKTLYESGDWSGATGASLQDWVTRWKSYLSDREQVPLGEGEIERARFRYDHKPVFARTCPLAVATAESEAGDLESRHNFPVAEALRRDVVEWRDGEPAKRYSLATHLAKSGALENAASLAHDIAESEAAGNALRAKARELYADTNWAQGNRDTSTIHYAGLLAAPLSLEDHRRLEAKLLALEISRSDQRDALMRYLTGLSPKYPHTQMNGNWDRILAQAHLEAPHSGLIAYLLGVRLASTGRVLESIVPLSWALSCDDLAAGGAERIRAEAHRRLGSAWYLAGNSREALSHFSMATKLLPADADGLQMALGDWRERVLWLEALPSSE